jgi:hypothetical protein
MEVIGQLHAAAVFFIPVPLEMGTGTTPQRVYIFLEIRKICSDLDSIFCPSSPQPSRYLGPSFKYAPTNKQVSILQRLNIKSWNSLNYFVIYFTPSAQSIQHRIMGSFMDDKVKNRILGPYRSTITAYSWSDCYIQGDQKVSMHLMIKIQKVTWLNLTAWQPTDKARATLDSH